MSADNDKGGIVYVLTNPAMPGLVKIGKTKRDEVAERLRELYKTGVPAPFVCEFAVRVSGMEATEKALHQAFSPYRPNPKREFFEIKPEQAKALLDVIGEEDVTPDVRQDADEVDEDAAKRARSRAPRWSFEALGVPDGTELVFLKDEDEKCTVETGTTVRYDGEGTSLGTLTQRLLDVPYSVRPVSYWLHDGRTLQDLYEEVFRTRPALDEDHDVE